MHKVNSNTQVVPQTTQSVGKFEIEGGNWRQTVESDDWRATIDIDGDAVPDSFTTVTLASGKYH